MIDLVQRFADHAVDVARQDTMFGAGEYQAYIGIFCRDTAQMLASFSLGGGSQPVSIDHLFSCITNARRAQLSGWPSSFDAEAHTSHSAGAVLAGEFIVSVCGLPSAHANEAVALVTCVHFRLLMPSQAGLVADMANNRLFLPLMRAVIDYKIVE